MNNNYESAFHILKVAGTFSAQRKATARLLLRYMVLAGLAAIAALILGWVFGYESTLTSHYAWLIILSAIPLPVITQWWLTRFSLGYKRLGIARFQIGRTEYKTANGKIVDGDGRAISPQTRRDLALFTVASRTVCHESELSLPDTAHEPINGFLIGAFPNLAVQLSNYGPNNKPYAFVYGDPNAILEQATAIWDLGHIRKLTVTDTANLQAAAKKWRRSGVTVALAYTSLPDNHDMETVNTSDIRQNLTILGVLQLQSARGQGQLFLPDIASNLKVGLSSSLTSSWAWVFLAFASLIGTGSFNLPPIVSIWQLILFKAALELVPVTSLALDSSHVNKKKGLLDIYDIAWSGLLMASLAFGNFLLYFAMHGYALAEIWFGSDLHLGGSTLALLTLTLCQLVNIWSRRGVTRRQAAHNPLFLVAAAGVFLLSALLVYSAGPLTLFDWALAVVAAAIFAFARWFKSYADTHHTRDKLLRLLGN